MACTTNESSSGRTVPVPIRGFQYTPSVLSAQVGDTVVWTNEDIVPHTVTGTDGPLDSGPIAPNASWRYVAVSKGTAYSYLCTFHPSMRGTLRVE